jgi:hypothetical protein
MKNVVEMRTPVYLPGPRRSAGKLLQDSVRERWFGREIRKAGVEPLDVILVAVAVLAAIMFLFDAVIVAWWMFSSTSAPVFCRELFWIT